MKTIKMFLLGSVSILIGLDIKRIEIGGKETIFNITDSKEKLAFVECKITDLSRVYSASSEDGWLCGGKTFEEFWLEHREISLFYAYIKNEYDMISLDPRKHLKEEN